MKLYVIWDKVAEEGNPISGYKNDGVALREYGRWQAEAAAKGQDPNDFVLMCIGEYYEEKPILVAEEPYEVQPTISMVDQQEEVE